MFNVLNMCFDEWATVTAHFRARLPPPNMSKLHFFNFTHLNYSFVNFWKYKNKE